MLEGKTVLVTGSTSGIGEGIAEEFAAQGCNIVLNGFGDPSEIEALRARIAKVHGVTVCFDSADMSKPDAIQHMMTRAIREFGAVDVLVNNAGVQHVAPIEEFPVDKWDAIIAIDLAAAFHTIRHALPTMKQRRWGRVINVASAHALVASPFKSAYVAAKHGMAGLTKAVALEVAERGITEEQVVRDVLLAAQPTKQFVGVKEVAALAVFLASDAAASITGAILPVDGGWTAH